MDTLQELINKRIKEVPPDQALNIRTQANRMIPEKKIILRDKNAEKTFADAFETVIPGFKMIPEYKEIISWLDNNQGKGLCLIGANGRGKTIAGSHVIPLIFFIVHGRSITRVNAQEMNTRLDDLLKKKFLSIDDIGTEDQIVSFGNRRWAFPELIDNAEKKRNILIITSNLDADAIEQKYGIRTRERVRATCKTVVFKGKSLRT